jgi:hydrogenase/urease accessory protein HupE
MFAVIRRQRGRRPRTIAVPWFALLAVLSGTSIATAHNPDTSYARFEIAPEAIDTKFTYDLFTLLRIAPRLDADNDRAVTADELAAQTPAIYAYLRKHIQFEVDGVKADFGEQQPVAFPPDSGGRIAEKDYHSAGALVHFAFHKPLARPARDVWVLFEFFGELGERHTVLGVFKHQGRDHEVLFRRFEPDYLYDTGYMPPATPPPTPASPVPESPDVVVQDEPGSSTDPAATGSTVKPEAGDASTRPLPTAGSSRPRSPHQRSNTNSTLWGELARFFNLGVEHIFLGYDHILFLLSLIVVCRFRQLLKIVTAFTAAHTITLILATLEVVKPDPRFVESAIALTIVYVAVENFWLKDTRRRWMLAFGFGLIHGFGFAGVLRELGLPTQGLVRCLLSFNVGVEAGQLAIVLLLFPLAALIARWRYGRQAQLVISAAIALCGLGWFLQRAFGLVYMPF